MTRGEIIGAVLARLTISSADTVDVEQAQLQLNQEYLRLASEEHLNTETVNLVLLAGDPLVDLPPDFISVDTISVGTRRLRYVHRQRLLDTEAGGVSESEADEGPSIYSFWSPTRIRVWPAPAASFTQTVRLVYSARPTLLAGDLDTPIVLPEEYHDLLVEQVIARLAATREEAFDIAAVAQARADTLRGQLRRHLRERMGVGDNRLRLSVYSMGRRL